jgi:hypothetical protein
MEFINRDYTPALATATQKDFWDLLTRENPLEFLFLKPKPFVDGMVPKILLKSIFLNFGHTTPSEPRYFIAMEIKDPRPAPPGNGEPGHVREPCCDILLSAINSLTYLGTYAINIA